MKRTLTIISLFWVWVACQPGQPASETTSENDNQLSPLKEYVDTPDSVFKYELRNTIEGDGYTTYVLYMESQRWLTEKEVKDPLWWHWINIVVPDEVKSDISLLMIGGGSRKKEMPFKPSGTAVEMALYTGTIVAELHNIPNQTTEFVGDNFGPRVEDELIAYGWSQFLKGGARKEDAKWLARLPMTKASVRAMDAVSGFCSSTVKKEVNKYVVAGASKRGWTTWTTAVVDERVVAIAPIVIDMLNLIPSFQHHWQVYGFWAPAVDSYVNEGIMDWINTEEYKKLMAITEPYTFLEQLTLPKFIVNASGDQFFLPDSWQFYWNDLRGETHLRYVPNADHGLDGSDAIQSIAAFYKGIVDGAKRPDIDWIEEEGVIRIDTYPEELPDSIILWQAYNPEARDFRVETLGKVWQKEIIAKSAEGKYEISVEAPEKGFKAFFVELKFPGSGDIPYTFSTGVVVTPDRLPFPPFEAEGEKPAVGE